MYHTRLMPPVDINATVMANARLSRDYSVLSLAAPEVGRRTAPGQFVMVKPAGVTDPLLRRPFSVFEVLRDAAGEVTGVSILNKRAGRSTNKLYELEPGDVVGVHASPKPVTLLHPKGYRYFSMLRQKLRWHERAS